MIPYGKQDISQDDIDAVVSVLKSDFLTQGSQVPKFEQKIKDYCNVEHAFAVNSATSALHIACLALGVSQEDIVWTSPISFVASANCALYCGASIDFVDIDPLTYNMSTIELEKKLILAKEQNKLPKVVIPVHLCGTSCDMAKIHQLSLIYGFKIIEDAAHAIGGKYNGEPVGSCKYSDICVFSFHPVKIITTAEGGVATTKNKKLAEKMALYRSHGITRDNNQMTEESHGAWYYQQIDLGFNYRMTELQASLGVTQMDRLDEFVAKRHEIAKIYQEKLRKLPIKLPIINNNPYSALHLYIIKLDLDKIDLTHKEVFDQLRAKGIGANLHYIPIHTQPYYQKLGFKAEDFPQAMKYYKQAISLPMFHLLSSEDQNYIIEVLKDILV